MSTNEQNLIADAINKDSKRDRKFGYFLVSGFMVFAIIIGYVMWGLISTLAGNMQSMADDMNTMKNSLIQMNGSVGNMDKSTNGMFKDIHKMNELNPVNLFK